MKYLLLILATLILSACQPKDTDPFACEDWIPASNGKPAILVIGDSISMGYTPFVKSTLANYDVVHNPCNAMNSHNTLKRIDGWLSTRASWEAITFNNGLWDISSDPTAEGNAYQTDDQYRANLTEIAQRIKQHTTHPLFILSTEVPIGATYRVDVDIQTKNAIAVQVMAAEGIPTLDLYTYSKTITADHIAPDNVHWTAAGSQLLADQITTKLQTEYGIQ